MSGSSALVLASTEGSFPNAVGDESKQVHVDPLDVKVSNNQSVKDSFPVIEHAGSSGQGLPYAPENWPSPGDVWTWHVGKRTARTGFWVDRSLQVPDSLRSSTGKKTIFRSRVSLEQYIRKTFPDFDVDSFFALFSWKIPCTNAARDDADTPLKIIKSNGCSESTLAVRPGDCKANNEMCSIKAKTNSSLTPAACNICCAEPNFCPYCCCILCSKTIDWTYEGCKFIKCAAPIDEEFICGHVAHIECAVRASLAGKVGGSIDLDVQYYCRCCDNKTDLLLHVEKIIKVCESIGNRDDIGKVLNLGFCILRGSEKEKAKELQNHIALLLEKLKHGVSADEKLKRKGGILQLEQDKELMMDTSEVGMNTHLITPIGGVPNESVHRLGNEERSNFQTSHPFKKRKIKTKETMSLRSQFIARGRGTWSRKHPYLPQRFRRLYSPNYYSHICELKPTAKENANAIEQFDQCYNKMREVFYETVDKARVIQAEREFLTTQVRSLTKSTTELKEENAALQKQYDDLYRTHNELSQTRNELSRTFVEYVHKHDEEFKKLKDDFESYKVNLRESRRTMHQSKLQTSPNNQKK